MLRASVVETPLDRTTLPGVISRLPASILGYPSLSVRVLASTHVVIRAMISKRPLVWFLRVEIFSLISLHLNSTLLIEVIASLLHRPLYIDSGIVRVYVGGVLAYRHPLLDGWVEFGLELIHLKPLVGFKG